VGGGYVEEQLTRNGMSVRRICETMTQDGLGINNLRPGGSHYANWMDRVLMCYDEFDYDKFSSLGVTLPFEAEMRNDANACFTISDGNHHALALAIRIYVEKIETYKPINVIISWGDRRSLREKFNIKI